jgi:hypothetical protein
MGFDQLPTRFSRKIYESETGCWLCKGAGVSRPARGGGPTHRIIYEEVIGPIPTKHNLHHTCENIYCVNPFHMEPLTPSAHFHRHNPWVRYKKERTRGRTVATTTQYYNHLKYIGAI